MKTKLIMLDTPIIVSDEKIRVKDYAIQLETKEIFHIHEVLEEDHLYLDNTGRKHWDNYDPWVCKKIIAGIEGLPLIDWNGLEEKFGYNNKLPVHLNDYINSKHTQEECIGFIDGFEKAQSLNEKKFSLEDMQNAISFGVNTKYTSLSVEGIQTESKKFIQSLQQPKVFEIEIEMEMNGLFPMIPKVTNNSIKILKKL